MTFRQRFARWSRRGRLAGSWWLLACLAIAAGPALSRAGPPEPASTGAPLPAGQDVDDIEVWYLAGGVGGIVSDGDIDLEGTVGQFMGSLSDDVTDISLASGYLAGVDLSDTTDADVPIADMTDVPIVGFSLGPVFPNPSHGISYLEWAVPHPARLRLAVHDVLGREVAVLFDGPHEMGRFHMTWNMAHRGMAAGLYFLSLETQEGVFTRRVVLTR